MNEERLNIQETAPGLQTFAVQPREQQLFHCFHGFLAPASLPLGSKLPSQRTLKLATTRRALGRQRGMKESTAEWTSLQILHPALRPSTKPSNESNKTERSWAVLGLGAARWNDCINSFASVLEIDFGSVSGFGSGICRETPIRLLSLMFVPLAGALFPDCLRGLRG